MLANLWRTAARLFSHSLQTAENKLYTDGDWSDDWIKRSHLKSSEACSRPVNRRNLENRSKNNSKFCPENLGNWSNEGSFVTGRVFEGVESAGSVEKCVADEMAWTLFWNDGDSVVGWNGLSSGLLRSSVFSVRHRSSRTSGLEDSTGTVCFEDSDC